MESKDFFHLLKIRYVRKIPGLIPFWLGLIAVFTAIYDLGFDNTQKVQNELLWIYDVVIIVGIASLLIRYFADAQRNRRTVRLFDLISLVFLSVLLVHIIGWIRLPVFHRRLWTYMAVLLVFIREFSSLEIRIKRTFIDPAQLFIASFFLMVSAGAALLMLPKATHDGISLIDALFTSTSAVCVTGLIVVDTGTYFTDFGLLIILFLIQIGGLGIMTFASYFSYFFKGGSTYENQLMLHDMTNTEKIGEVFSTLKKIILLTLGIEATGAVLIFTTLDPKLFSALGDRIFFSVFHSVSSFCNAGFSTLGNSLYEETYRFNYPLHLIIALLFILGGIGFPIAFNFMSYIKHLLIRRLSSGKERYKPWVINLNTRIVLITTGILLIGGTILFYIFEYDNTLAEHNGFGKVVTAFFGAATPRTAGFNSVDLTKMHFSTIMVTFLFMWIGASPASTGGGIKTSTIAIATLNFLSIARGKSRVEVFRREVSDISIRRAFAIISLSLIVIGFSIFLIATFDSGKDLLSIAFESFSAYSTVGISLGITPHLNSAGKVIIILTMFIGRVSMLSILVALFRKVKSTKYKYPTEEILIN
ncbi:MAG TPA: potassium transporter TrkG [Flavilitoribacter sp.]|nr:potassium transporter TrkG [Flavilitoribacter sp.]